MRLGFAFALFAAVGLSAHASGPASGIPQTFRADTLSIEIDARVIDKRHQFVRDLQQSEFTLRDDGKPQTIATFALVDLPRVSWPEPTALSQTTQPAPAAGAIPAGRIYGLVVDDVHIDSRQAKVAAAAVKQFIDTSLSANDGAAIICTFGPSSPNVTNVRETLRAGVDACLGSGNPGLGTTNSSAHGEQVQATVMTMRRLSEVASALGRVAGRRKSIVLFSQGSDLNYTALRQDPDALEVIEATQAAVAAATRANVTIYAVDPRGPSSPNDSAIEVQSLPRGPQAALQLQRAQQDASTRAQNNLRALSDETGGFTTVNQHDFSKAFARIVDENSSYYLLGLAVAPERRDGKPHKIEVSVTRRGLDVQGNRSYVLPPIAR